MGTTDFLTGQRLTADLLNTNIIDVPDVTVVTATVGTVASGFSVNDVRAATLSDGKHVDIDLYCARTGADITATSGNIADTLMFTLAAAYRPTHIKSAIWGNGTSSGEATVDTAGLVTLRTASSTINGTAGSGVTNLRLSVSFIIS
jgi:hypothetical protein